jgi:hypothetical protein
MAMSQSNGHWMPLEYWEMAWGMAWGSINPSAWHGDVTLWDHSPWQLTIPYKWLGQIIYIYL